MDAVEFLKGWKRMCESCSAKDNVGNYCKESCPLLESRESLLDSCKRTVLNHPEQSIYIVSNWSKEHPEKTRKEDFQEKYPKAEYRMDGIGTPNICCKKLGYTDCCPTGKSCVECWNEPVK